MEAHAQVVDGIASTIRGFFKSGQSYRVSHGSSNSTRPGHATTRQNVVDISKLSNVITVNKQEKIALVEPNVPMDRLVEATLEHGLVPPVVMEFPGITVGGGFSGTSGESSSFRHGFFDETVNSVEMVLGNGDVVTASRDERPDLFHGAAGAVGTLGIVTLVELRLVEAKKLVKTTYRRVQEIPEAISEIQKQTANPSLDYIDGIVFSREHSVIITGELTNEKPAETGIRTFSNADDPWFYMHVREITRELGPSAPTVVEYIPLGEYLFRYDRAGFWVGRQGYTYFKLIPFNKFFRWLLDDYSHTRTLYHALHAGGIAEKFVVQDLALPYDTAECFINWVDKELGIWPLWLCPLRGGCSLPTFHPVTALHLPPKSTDEESTDSDGEEIARPPRPEVDSTRSQPMLNIGVWGWGPSDHETFVYKNRALEVTLGRLGGRKWLYAHTYYTEEEFWNEYDHGSQYQRLREKYFATTLPTVYDKVKVRPSTPDKEDGQSSSGWLKSPLNLGKWISNDVWLRTWPIGGIYGMIRATLSGDISLHRDAKWRYKRD
ncbi:hypothetical protein V8F06_008344 [Rhypophila decipiens]